MDEWATLAALGKRKAAADSGFGDPNLQEQIGLYDILRGGQEYPGAMMPISPLSFADRLQSFGARGAPDIENREGETTLRQRQHAWTEMPLPLGREIWANEIQRALGTNYTLPWNKEKLPARLIPRGQLPRDIGTEDVGK
jgi:hypothetical protein